MKNSRNRCIFKISLLIGAILSISLIYLTVYQFFINLNRIKGLRNLRKLKIKILKRDSSRHKIVFFGDQHFYYWKKAKKKYFNKKIYINKGKLNDTTSDMVNRFKKDVIKIKPYAVVILGGANDFEGIEKETKLVQDYTFPNIKKLIRMAKFHRIKVAICTLIPGTLAKYSKNQFKDYSFNFYVLNTMLLNYTKKKKIPFIDLYGTVLQNKKHELVKKYTDDGVILNAEGYKIFEEIIYKGLKNAEII